MSNKSHKILEEQEEILRLLASHNNGASLEEIHQLMTTEMASRTLARRLTALLKDGKIVCFGRARAARYALLEEKEVLVSTDEIKAYVNLPKIKRCPTSYDANFLRDYRPGVTFYLPESVRKHLAKIG